MMNFGNKREVGNTNYSCSMHCEGDKTYNQPGDCPVCGMHLVPVGGPSGEHGEQHIAKENKKTHGNKGHSCCG